MWMCVCSQGRALSVRQNLLTRRLYKGTAWITHSTHQHTHTLLWQTYAPCHQHVCAVSRHFILEYPENMIDVVMEASLHLTLQIFCSLSVLSSSIGSIKSCLKMQLVCGESSILVLKSGSNSVFLFSLSVGDTAGSCGDPGIPSHGSREQTDFRIRSKVHFSCSEGFDLIGSSERMCFPNGTWSGTQPFCKRREIL